jgi:hypothetical protein
VHAGEPFLLAYPVDLLLLRLGGWHSGLGLGPALHLWLALAGGSWLGRRLGLSPLGAWLAGTAYGLSGFVLSLVNLVQLFEAAAWAPWVVAAALGLSRRPNLRAAALLGTLLALQTSTLGVEIVAQTLVVALVLTLDAGWLRPRRWLSFLAAAALAAAIAAPALAGAAWVTRGTARAGGFPREAWLAHSLHPGALPELALPRWLGDPHAFSDADYWGAPFFPEGFPYLVSLYAGAGVLLLASQAGSSRRLWLLVAGGALLAVGSHGPLALLPGDLRLPIRGPQKFLFLAQVGLSLLAGIGLDRCEREPPGGLRRALLLAAGAAPVGAALVVVMAPDAFLHAAARLLSELRSPQAAVAAHATWPAAWVSAGALALAAALALARGGRLARLAALAVAVDLASANGAVNPLAPAAFYDLRPDVAGLLRPVRDGDGRLFSYGVAQTPTLRFEPVLRAAPSDVWLYYLDRQSLFGSTPVLDGIDTAGGADQTGFTPTGASLRPDEAVPERFLEHREALEHAGVRWVLSFHELAEPFAQQRGSAKLPEVVMPLRLYELPGAAPRAGFVTPGASRLDSQGAPSSVRWRRLDAHAIRLEVRSPPGIVVLAETHHPDWQAEGPSGPTPVLRIDGHLALATPGGEQSFTLRFRPAWPRPSLLLSALGVAAAAAAFGLGCVRRHRPARADAC